MKRMILFLTAAAACFAAHSLMSQASEKRAGLQSKLALALKQFPDADSNSDGKLTLVEAMAYAEKHPEVKSQFLAKNGSTKSSSKPADFPPGASGTRVFVCAHSYMIYTADWVPPLAVSAGLSHLRAGQQMIGGSRVLQHWDLPDELNQAKKALKEGMVDFLTLSPHLILPDEGIDLFTRLGLERNPELRVIVQASWAPRDGKLLGEFTNSMRDSVTVDDIRRMRDAHHGGWLKQLESQVSSLNASLGKPRVFILPVSEAVYSLRESVAQGRAPGLAKQSELFRDDHGHPSEILALLVSYCHFASIYRRNPEGLPVPARIKDHPEVSELNHLLQRIAWMTVKGYPMSGLTSADDS